MYSLRSKSFTSASIFLTSTSFPSSYSQTLSCSEVLITVLLFCFDTFRDGLLLESRSYYILPDPRGFCLAPIEVLYFERLVNFLFSNAYFSPIILLYLFLGFCGWLTSMGEFRIFVDRRLSLMSLWLFFFFKISYKVCSLCFYCDWCSIYF